MSEMKFLKKIEKDLVKLDYDCMFDEGDEKDGMFPTLAVTLGKDDQDRDLIMTLSANETDLSSFEESENAKKGESQFCVTFLVVYPFNIKEDCEVEVCLTLNMLNTMADLPGFMADLIDNKIYYKHTWITTDKFDTDTLNFVASDVMMTAISFSKILEEVALGHAEYEEIFNSMEAFNNIPQEKLLEMLENLSDEDLEELDFEGVFDEEDEDSDEETKEGEEKQSPKKRK